MDTSNKRFQAVYTIVPRADGKDLWLRVGSAFPNRDGSLSVLLDAMPVNGRLQVREYQPREANSARHGEPESANGRHAEPETANDRHAEPQTARTA